MSDSYLEYGSKNAETNKKTKTSKKINLCALMEWWMKDLFTDANWA